MVDGLIVSLAKINDEDDDGDNDNVERYYSPAGIH